MQLAETTIEILQSSIRKKIKSTLLPANITKLSRQKLLTQMLRGVILPDLLQKHSTFNTNRYLNIRHLNPYIWQKLPHILNFGHSQGLLFHDLRQKTPIRTKWVANASALLNLAIVLYDYLLDEHHSQNAGRFITKKLVRQLLGKQQKEALSYIDRMATDTSDPLFHLLLCTMAAWVRYVNALPGVTEKNQFINLLDKQIIDMFKAELETTHLDFPGSYNLEKLQTILYRKSVGPTLSVCLISFVANPPENQYEQKLLGEVADTTGKIIYAIDDLCDIEHDLKRQAPNIILLKTFGIKSQDKKKDEFYSKLNKEADSALQETQLRLEDLEKTLEQITTDAQKVKKFIHWLQTWIYCWLTPISDPNEQIC